MLLENFREVLDQLSPEIQQRLQRLRQLDQEYEVRRVQLHRETNAYFHHSRRFTAEERREKRSKFSKEYANLRAIVKEKEAVSETVYQAMKKYEERLNKDYEDYKREMETDNPGVTEQIEARFRETIEAARGIPPKPKPVKRRVHSLGDEEEAKPRADPVAVRKASLNIPIDGRMRSINMEKMLELRKRSLTVGAGGLGSSSSTSNSNTDATKSFLQSLANAISKRRASTNATGPVTLRDLVMASASVPKPIQQSSPVTTRLSSTTLVKSLETGGSSASSPTVVLACSESRHGRQRKPTSRVQELIVDGLQHRPGRLERAAQSSFGINLTAVRKELDAEPPSKRSRGNTNDEEGAEDSEEKTWCICNEKSYGEMVACDNQKCRIEWFHYHCVKISAPPTGVWLCPECSKSKDIGVVVHKSHKTQPRG